MSWRTGAAALSLAVAVAVAAVPHARAQKLENPIAVFAGLDKISARITTFEVQIDETKRFGSLAVTPRVCYSRPSTEEPKTTAFVIVEDVENDGTREKIFSGWMFAQSPGLHAVEHPVYDVWLTDCRDPNRREDTLEFPDEGETLNDEE